MNATCLLDDNDLIKRCSYDNEAKVEKMFHKSRLKVIKIKTGKNKTPDFMICNEGGNPLFLCEVKTCFSDGQIEKTRYRKSLLDSEYISSGRMGGLPAPTCIKEAMEKARIQYREYMNNNPEFKRLPFVVPLFPEMAFEDIDSVPNDFYGFNEISAVIQIEKDRERGEQGERLAQSIMKGRSFSSAKELAKVLVESYFLAIDEGLPPPSKTWKVKVNKGAIIKIDSNILGASSMTSQPTTHYQTHNSHPTLTRKGRSNV